MTVVARPVLVACAVALAGLAGGLPGLRGTAAAQSDPPRVLVYGDSLTWEAQDVLEAAIERELPGWDAVVETDPGIAICDALPDMARDGDRNTRVVVMEFVAVVFSSCMQGRDWAAAHAADLGAALALWADRGVPVVLVGAPRSSGDPGTPTEIAALTREAALGAGEHFVDAGVLLRDPWTGVYRQRRPCLAGEGAREGCGADGLIDVRSPDGDHFCAIPDRGPCPVYSSGAVRYSAPIAATTAQVVGRPSTPMSGPAEVPGAVAALRALFGPPDAAAGPKRDRKVARRAALTADDVPDDFAEEAPAAVDTTPEGPECRSVRRAAAVLGTAAAADRAFRAPGGFGSIDGAVRILPGKADATRVYRALSEPGAGECLHASLREQIRAASGDPGAEVTVSVSRLPSEAGDAATAYAVTTSIDGATGTATSSARVEVVRVGRAITGTVFADPAAAPPETVTDPMTGIVADRLRTEIEAVPTT